MPAAKSEVKREMLLALLILIYVFNTMDRLVIGLLAEPIRRDLSLTDTQLGLLTGLVFALFYTFFGIPVGWLADRVGRIRVIVGACVIWSVFSAMGGFAGSFTQLALARIGVGVGEAGGAAPSYSLISSQFGPRERGGALGLFNLGSPIAQLVGAFACTWIAAQWGWRAAVVAVSLPGLLVALILAVRVPEPRAPHGEAIPAPPLLRSLGEFLRTPKLWGTALTAGLTSFTTYAMMAWLPAFLMRAKGMTLKEVGVWFAIGNAIAFALGLWGGGRLADAWARRTSRAYALTPCLGLLIAAPFIGLAIWAPSWQLSLAFWLVPIMTVATFLAPGVTLVQNLAAPQQRALFGAIYLFVNNLIGSGIGPLYVGAISDHLRPTYGNQALGYGLAACIPVVLIAAAGQFLVSRLLPKGPPEEP